MNKKEASEKLALRARLADIAQGACGKYPANEDPEEGSFITGVVGIEALGRFVAACKVMFGYSGGGQKPDGKAMSWVFEPENLATFDDLDVLVEQLYAQGVRA